MADLLTHEEYKAIAASLELPQNAWIDGAYRPAISGKTFETVNPATGEVLGTVAEKVHRGGKIVREGSIEPTIVEVGSRESALVADEIFGPILTVVPVATFEEAIAVANDTEYGLAASIFTANGKRALRGARMLRAGTVTVNSFGEGDITTPFGGYKQSGFGGRDNSIHAHDQYTQLKTIWLDLTDSSDTSID